MGSWRRFECSYRRAGRRHALTAGYHLADRRLDDVCQRSEQRAVRTNSHCHINNPWGGAFRNNRRPSVVPGVDPFLHSADGKYFLNPAAFTIPQPGTFGNLGRFALHGPNLEQFDFTLHKGFEITESQNVEFRAEIYNLLNHANFNNPPAVLSNSLGVASGNLQPGQPFTSSAAGSAFGVANATVSKDVGLGAQRQIQFSLRYNF